MVSRSLLALFAIALFFAVASAVPEEEEEVVVDVSDLDIDDDAERGIKKWAIKAGEKLVKEAAKYVKKEFKKLNTDCITEIFNTCDINPIMHPKKYFKCAKNYFVEHKDECYNSQ